MEFKVIAPLVRISPRKLGLLADELRGKDINQAMSYLSVSPRKKSANVFIKLIKNAAQNATNKGTVDIDTLFIKTLLIGKGPTFKRLRPRAKGAASQIHKKTSNITLMLKEK